MTGWGGVGWGGGGVQRGRGRSQSPGALAGFELWLRAGMVKMWEGFEHKRDSLPPVFTKIPWLLQGAQSSGPGREQGGL